MKEVAVPQGMLQNGGIPFDKGEGPRNPLSPGSAKRRKYTIEYLFTEVFGSPTEAELAAPNSNLRLSLPRVIMDMLDVPSNSKNAAIKAHEAGGKYGPSRGIKAGRSAKVLIKDFKPQAGVVYRAMESGIGPGSARWWWLTSGGARSIWRSLASATGACGAS